MPQGRNKKILIFSEAVSLAHVLRPHAVAIALAQAGYQIYFAGTGLEHIPNRTDDLNYISLPAHLSMQDFVNAIGKGQHPFTQDLLEKQVNEELELFEKVLPDLVMGDMRLTLHISTQLAKLKYINLSNSYWDPNAILPPVVPEMPAVHIFGETFLKLFFPIIQPIVFNQLARPFNRTAKSFNKKEYGNYAQVMTSGDQILYFDIENLVQFNRPSTNKHVMGALTYSMDIPIPAHFHFRADRKKVFVSLGSTGPGHLLQQIVEELKKMDLDIYVAAAGAKLETPDDKNVFTAKYLPFSQLAEKCDLVVTNGGSSGVYPALEQGKPSLMIPSNYDQQLFSEAIAKLGAGIKLPTYQFTSQRFQENIQELLGNMSWTEKSRALGHAMRLENPLQNCVSFVGDLLKN